jgi:cardiolipin synthase
VGALATSEAPPRDGAVPAGTLPADRAALAHRLWRIGAARVSTGNRVALLRDGAATFDAMLARIEAARDRVSLESYIVESDAVGERFAPALIAAARRGVRTRVLFDWIGSRYTSRAFVRRLRHGGVEVGVFNRPSLRRRWFGLLPRDHRKLLVVDGAAGVIGGIGIGHQWTVGNRRRAEERTPWRDTADEIEGPAARDMEHVFERSWSRVVDPGYRDSDDSRPTEVPTRASLDDGLAMVGIVEGEPGRYRVARSLEVTAVSATRSIWISDAYFMPNMTLMEALTGAARDGVDVRLLVPSRGDHPWMVRATRRYYPRLLKNGVRIWEWQGEMMHAKTSVVDGRYVRIGSTDFNLLGMAINFELDAMIEDAALGAAANAMFEQDIALSRAISGAA